MYTLMSNQIATSTPVPTQPSAELIEQATRVIDTFSQLGPLMAVLFVVALSLVVIVLIQFSSRNANSAAISVLASANAAKESEIVELKAQREQDRRQHIDSLTTISVQATRANDLFDAMNKRSDNRDKQQSEIVITQGRIAASFDKLINEGSAPLQHVAQDVTQLLTLIGSVDVRTSNWQPVIDSIPLIKKDINDRLDQLMAELQKRSTKPIPMVDGASIQNEASPL